MAKFQKLSDEHLARLRMLGFVHVTGLKSADFKIGARREVLIQAHLDQRGKMHVNNGMIVLITLDGQVWLAHSDNDDDDAYKATCEIAHHLGIDNGFAFVPCTNGESIATPDLLRRILDPYEESRMTVEKMFTTT